MVTAFGNFQIRVVLRRQLDALRRHQVDERRMRFRQVHMHRVHHFAQCVRAGNGQHLGVHLQDDVVASRVFFRAQTAGHDDLAVLMQRLADGVERFLYRSIDKAAGIDDHQIGAVIRFGGVVTFGTQLSKNLLGVD